MSHTAQQYYQDNFEIVELKSNSTLARIVVNIGNTLFSLKQKNEKIYFPFSFEEYKANAKLAGNPFMHPWANRLEGEYICVENKQYCFPKEHLNLLYRDGNNLPLHGLLLKSDKWKTIELHEEENLCYHVAEFIFDDADFLSIFPFKHKIQIKHQIQGDELKIETMVLNIDEKEMPVSFGFHPYFFRKNMQAHLTIPAAKVIEVNEVMIPTGNIISKENKWDFVNDEISLEKDSFDDGFQELKLNENNQAVFLFQTSQTEANQTELVDRTEFIECPTELVEVLFDTNYPFVQIYAPQNPAKPYVCIEPMTAATNALNENECKKIKTNEQFTACFIIK